MLKIKIPKQDLWDEEAEKFISIDNDTILCLEHSLLSISKWEMIWKKPFLSNAQLTEEQSLSYIQCMCINGIDDIKYYKAISPSDIKRINKYIEDPMTATFFNETKKKKEKKRIITNELIYYWMISFQIPKEMEKWHINRLLTLIKVCNEELEAQNKNMNSKNKRPSKSYLADRDALNAMRKAKLHSKG